MKIEFNEDNFNMLLERMSYMRNEVKKYKYDSLTGLRQRRDFDDTLQRAYERFEFEDISFHLCFVDAIGLHNKNRNDGYEAGNKLLVSIAHELVDTFDKLCPGSASEIFRISGDEFGVIVQGCISEKLESVEISNASVVSIHVDSSYCWPSPASIFKAADNKMIDVKEKTKVGRS